jgi:hypothetical protein
MLMNNVKKKRHNKSEIQKRGGNGPELEKSDSEKV